MEEEDDGEVIEPARPPKIKRNAKLDGKVVYGFWRLREGVRRMVGLILLALLNSQ